MKQENTLFDSPLMTRPGTLMDSVIKDYKKASDSSESSGQMLMKAKCYIEAGNYEKAIELYENILAENPGKLGQIIVPYARAFAKSGKEFDAIHWFRRAIDEFGKKECERELMRLYQTGVVGKELKEKADRYFA